MNRYADTPTCETGFWEPLHEGCPVCGPDGPCRDPAYEAAIQANVDRRRFRKLLMIVCALVIVAALAACQTPAVREVTVTKEVPAPYAAPCPKPEDKPIRPKRVAEDHPTMPADPGEQARILAAKLLEWLTYGDAADGVMTACSKP